MVRMITPPTRLHKERRTPLSMDKQRSAEKATLASQKVIRLLVSPKKIYLGEKDIPNNLKMQ